MQCVILSFSAFNILDTQYHQLDQTHGHCTVEKSGNSVGYLLALIGPAITRELMRVFIVLPIYYQSILMRSIHGFIDLVRVY